MVERQAQSVGQPSSHDSRQCQVGEVVDVSDDDKSDVCADRAREEDVTASIPAVNVNFTADREVFLRARWRFVRDVLLVVLSVAALAFLISAGYATYQAATAKGDAKPFSVWVWPIVSGFLGLYSLAGVVMLLANRQAAKQAVAEARAKDAVETVAREVQDDGDVINLLRLNRKEMEEYQLIARGQAKTSFMVSNMAMVAGLTLIIVGILVIVFSRDLGTKVAAASLSAIAGALAGFISKTFIESRNASLDQLNYYFNQPLVTSYLLHAERMVKEAPESERSKLRAAVIKQSLSNAEPTARRSSKVSGARRKSARSMDEEAV